LNGIIDFTQRRYGAKVLMQINFEKPALSDSAALREILIFCSNTAFRRCNATSLRLYGD